MTKEEVIKNQLASIMEEIESVGRHETWIKKSLEHVYSMAFLKGQIEEVKRK